MPEATPRFLLSLMIQDETGSLWVSAFDREAEVSWSAAKHMHAAS
jgi:hypothetical protein